MHSSSILQSDIRQPYISFYWCMFMADGIKPITAKIQDIADIQPFMDVWQLPKFLGFDKLHVYFCAPHILHHTIPFRELSKEKNMVPWNKAVNHAFQHLKALMATTFQKPLWY